MEIHQLLVSASPGDAITHEALLLRRHLVKVGPSYIFAAHLHPRVPEVKPLRDYTRMSSARPGRNLLIVHGSIGDEAFFDFLRRRREDIVLRYHNTTPPELVRRHDPRLARLLERAMRDLAPLAVRSRLALANSQYSIAALEGMGFANVRVVPVVFDVRELQALPAPARIPAPLRQDSGGPLVLFVGRLVPHKNQAAVLAAFHVLKTYLRGDARLALVGGGTPGAYVEALHRMADSLALLDVTFTGAVTPAVLAAAYRRANAFVCLSKHEGFGVPLIEAMAFGVPVVAWNTTAVGEIVADGGILLDSPTPTVVAEALGAVVEDGPTRDRLIERGRARAECFDAERSAAAFLRELLTVV